MGGQAGQRDPSVDWARGIAALAMIEGHAVHAWVSEPEKQSAAYAATRLVATAPLPAFMLLAGMAVRLRLAAAARRGEDPRAVRAGIVRRGGFVVLWGYLSSALYALMDGHQGLPTFLRADVLHVIGLSIAALALLRVDTARRALALTVAVTLLSPLYYRYAPAPEGPLGYVLAPFVRVPGITLFPLLPMIGWASFGFVAGDLIARARVRFTAHQTYAATALCALALAFACAALTRWLLGPNGQLDYVHVAGIPNMTGYAARGLLLIALAPLLVARLPRRAQGVVTRFGRASLIAYVFHIPFCYGLLGSPLRGRLDVLSCVPFVLLLALASYAAIVAIERARAASASAFPAARPSGALLESSPDRTGRAR